MSHPFCATEEACGGIFPHGWNSWNGKAIYIHTIIHPSVTHQQACGEAIRRWNEAVGARFLLVPDQGVDTIKFRELNSGQPPFVGNYRASGGLTQPDSHNVQIWLRSDMEFVTYREWVNMYAHEIGHAFSLADHPTDDINSVMSYQVSGRDLLGPSGDDVAGIAGVYGLPNLKVTPAVLDGIENITGIWQFDRYQGRGWWSWLPVLRRDTIGALVPYETYTVRAIAEGTLGYGRFELAVLPGDNRWVYL